MERPTQSRNKRHGSPFGRDALLGEEFLAAAGGCDDQVHRSISMLGTQAGSVAVNVRGASVALENFDDLAKMQAWAGQSRGTRRREEAPNARRPPTHAQPVAFVGSGEAAWETNSNCRLLGPRPHRGDSELHPERVPRHVPGRAKSRPSCAPSFLRVRVPQWGGVQSESSTGVAAAPLTLPRYGV